MREKRRPCRFGHRVGQPFPLHGQRDFRTISQGFLFEAEAVPQGGFYLELLGALAPLKKDIVGQ